MIPNNNFYNVQRLLIQEKGEQNYGYLAQYKRARMKLEAEDRVFRRKKYLHLTHQELQGSNEANMLDAEGKWRREEQLRQKRDEQNAMNVKILRYKIHRPTNYIAELFTNGLRYIERAAAEEESKQVQDGGTVVEIKQD